MKTRISILRTRGKAESGVAVTIVLILLGIMLVFVAANTVTVNWLRRQVNIVDKREAQRWTNNPVSK